MKIYTDKQLATVITVVYPHPKNLTGEILWPRKFLHLQYFDPLYYCISLNTRYLFQLSKTETLKHHLHQTEEEWYLAVATQLLTFHLFCLKFDKTLNWYGRMDRSFKSGHIQNCIPFQHTNIRSYHSYIPQLLFFSSSTEQQLQFKRRDYSKVMFVYFWQYLIVKMH